MLGAIVTPSGDRYNLAGEFLDRHVREGRGGRTAIVCGDARVSYGELQARVNQAGHALRALGVQEEQRVLLLLPDSPEFAVAWFAALKIGAIAVPTNTALRAADYGYVLDESRARVLIVHAALLDAVAPALAAQRVPPAVVVCGGEPPAGARGWDDWLRPQPAHLDAAPTCGDDLAFWLWTSGSTGPPKAAVHLHQDWRHCAEHYARGVLDIGADDVTFSSSKLFHAYGLGNGLMFPLHVGATTVLHPGRPTARAVLEIARRERPTLFFSVPTLYAAMLQEAEQGMADALASVRLAVSAAEPLPAGIFRRCRELFGVEVLDGIGSTEALHIYLSARAGRVRPGSTGQPVPGYAVRIVDAAGDEVAPGVVGDMLVAGDSTAPFYWRRRQLTAERMRGRWFFTGDKYSVDADGFYWYAGRSDDMFRVSGQWVSPIEIEGALIEHPEVLEAAVVAFQEETTLHTPKAFVVVKGGACGSADLARELQEFVKQRLTPYKYPRRIEFLAELPKNAAGKLLRYRLRAVGPTRLE